MSTNIALMKDTLISGDTLTGAGKGGFLNPEQAKKFISYMTDNSALSKDTRLETMSAPEKQLDFLLIGSHLIRKTTEASSPTELAGANITMKELRSVKVRLAADITTEMRAYLYYQGLHLKNSTEFIHIPAISFLRPVLLGEDFKNKVGEIYLDALRSAFLT